MSPTLTNLLLGFSLAVDACVVSVALTVAHRKTLTNSMRMAIPLCFGFFQALMPLIGWVGGSTLLSPLSTASSWIAATVLGLIGLNMLRNARKGDADEPQSTLNVKTILTLAVATSIDALAVGFTLPSLSSHPLISIVSIGCITFALCYFGMMLAHRIPQHITKPAEYIAGCVLIALGIKVLFM